jgi:hypothetical protein
MNMHNLENLRMQAFPFLIQRRTGNQNQLILLVLTTILENSIPENQYGGEIKGEDIRVGIL